MLDALTRRQLNDDRRRLFGGTPAIAFVCECADEECTGTIVLAPAEYDDARRLQPYLLQAEHEAPRLA